MDKDRKLTDLIFKFSDKDTYRCAMLNLNECLSKNKCIQEKCDRYNFCTGTNLSHIDLYVKKLTLENVNLKQAFNEIKDRLLCYGETFDSDIHKRFQKECLEIIEKLGDNNE